MKTFHDLCRFYVANATEIKVIGFTVYSGRRSEGGLPDELLKNRQCR